MKTISFGSTKNIGKKEKYYLKKNLFFFLNCKIHQYRIEYNNIITSILKSAKYLFSHLLYSKKKKNLHCHGHSAMEANETLYWHLYVKLLWSGLVQTINWTIQKYYLDGSNIHIVLIIP
jgi:hypothetical protein